MCLGIVDGIRIGLFTGGQAGKRHPHFRIESTPLSNRVEHMEMSASAVSSKRIPLPLLVLYLGIMCPVVMGYADEEQNKSSPQADLEIRGTLLDSEIVIRTTRRLAGAIDSVVWRGQEFIDSADHGRQLQSASNFDAGSPMIPETFNPTEAGSVFDGAGPTSSSRLLHSLATHNRLQTTTQMAFWLRPDGKSLGNPAKNRTVLSNHLLTKRVELGYRDLPQVIRYDVTFGLPVDEQHTFAQFEILTGYMPAEFRQFLTYRPASDEFQPLSPGPGEQQFPVVLATEDGRFAMGCYSPQTLPDQGWSGPTYGRFQFERERVVKWNCVARLRKSTGVEPGDYSFRTFVILGDLDLVQQGFRALVQEFSAPKK